MSIIQSFVLAMLLYPEVQQAAQRELDRVIGPDCLPTFADQASLPYITAVAKEALRCASSFCACKQADENNVPDGILWRRWVSSVLNFDLNAVFQSCAGLAHRVTAEDEYKGHRIPKGSIVLGNAW